VRKNLLRGAAYLALLWIGLGITMQHFARNRLEEQQQSLATHYAAVESRIKADLKALAHDPLFDRREGPNVVPLLEQHVRHFDREWTGPRPAPTALLDDLRSWGPAWLDHADDPRLAALDLSWMSELKNAGTWDSDRALDSSDLTALIKLRLLQGLQRGEARAASLEVHELARLMASSENALVFSSLRHLFTSDASALAEANRRGQSTEGWVVNEHLERYFRAVFAASATRSLLATPPMSQETLGPLQCAVLSSAVEDAHALSLLLQRGLRQRYADLAAEVRDSPCRLTRARALLEHPEQFDRMPVSTSSMCGIWITPPCVPEVPVGWLPFVRFPIGVMALTHVRSNELLFYEKMAP
jgi:hypothetical protein